MRTSMGMATAFLASNMVYGPNWDVDAAETLDAAATQEKFPKGEYFIVDVQTHFTDGVAIGFRKAEFVRIGAHKSAPEITMDATTSSTHASTVRHGRAAQRRAHA